MKYYISKFVHKELATKDIDTFATKYFNLMRIHYAGILLPTQLTLRTLVRWVMIF